ncbi:hypothetical protein AB4Z39_13630 [Mycobacterium adipatum]
MRARAPLAAAATAPAQVAAVVLSPARELAQVDAAAVPEAHLHRRTYSRQ